MHANATLGLERPTFGQFARQHFSLRSDQLAEHLEDQRRTGGRLGDILKSRGVLNSTQILEILSMQAAWVARVRKSDLASTSFPYQTFFSLCMPAYNEESNIEDTLNAALAILPHFVTKFEIVVVDDGSRDRTAEIVAAYSERHPCVRLLRHEQNRGYGAAVTTALRGASGDLVAFTDSDGQFSFLDLPQLLTRLEGHDLVIGYRHQRADSRIRLFNAWGWNWVIRVVLGVWVKDLDCAFKLFRREVLEQICLTSTGATINAEILVQCNRRGFKHCEVPVSHWPRCAGQATGAALKVILKAFRDLPKMWQYRYEVPATKAAGFPADAAAAALSPNSVNHVMPVAHTARPVASHDPMRNPVLDGEIA